MNKKILVLGDVMLDHYIDGVVNRISPESPIPVLRKTTESYFAGGAANVAKNIADLECDVALVGVVGVDDAGKKLSIVLSNETKIHNEFVTDKNRATTIKSRIRSQQHNFIRVDNEDTFPISVDIEELITNKIDQLAPDFMIISDYAKGVVTERVLKHALAMKNTKVLIDPKSTDLSRYRGAFIFKPNFKEFCEIISETPQTEKKIATHAKRLCEQYNFSYMLITRSAEGMLLVSRNGDFVSYEAISQKKHVDVAGAGDTVIATLCAMLADGYSVMDAVELANKAASIVVGKLGTSSLTRAELFSKIRLGKTPVVHSHENYMEVINNWKQQGVSVSFTNGCFDLIHKGHIRVLRGASELADKLVVAINDDTSIRALKGDDRPIQKQDERAAILSSFEFVDMVLIFKGDDLLDILETMKPDVISKGSDYSEDQVVGSDIVTKHGGEIVLIPFEEGFSTTKRVGHIRSVA